MDCAAARSVLDMGGTTPLQVKDEEKMAAADVQFELSVAAGRLLLGRPQAATGYQRGSSSWSRLGISTKGGCRFAVAEERGGLGGVTVVTVVVTLVR